MGLIAPQDAAFLMLESREHPMHVGALTLFDVPPHAEADYVNRFYSELLDFTELRPLLRRRPQDPVSSIGQVWWDTDDDVDLEYHVRPSALPTPGRVRELLALVSRLHSGLLDRHRPLWEFHLIEGLEGGRFATYTKLHHALIDGVSGMRLLTGSLSEDPNATVRPFWAVPQGGAKPKHQRRDERGLGDRVLEQVKAAADALRNTASATPRLATLTREVFEGQREAVSMPAPRTMFNVSITGARRFAAQSWPIDRLRAAGTAAGATLNDIVMAMCSGALRRYLSAHSALPDRALVAAVPVSLALRDPKTGGERGDGGNAIGAVLCSLATDVADPHKRLETIRASMRTAKDAMADLTPMQFQAASTALLGGTAVLGSIPKAADFAPQLYNLIISNVPGPKNPLYWNGARMVGAYPVSVPGEGQALNMTVTSYAGSMEFGLTGCRRSVPGLQRMLDYLEDSLAEMEP